MPFLPFTQVELTCEQCGQRFLAPKKVFRTRRFCTPRCGYAWRTRRSAETALARALARVDKHGPVPDLRPDLGACWISDAAGPQGYPSIYVAGRAVLVHRLVYEGVNGPIPDGLELDHLCRRPGCVRPSHLEPVTHAENVRRGANRFIAAHRDATCLRGHALGGKNLIVIAASGAQRCRTCSNERSRRYQAERRVKVGRLRGERHHQAKLTEQAVREIRAEHAAGVSMKAIARQRGLAYTAIRSVITRKTWRHVL